MRMWNQSALYLILMMILALGLLVACGGGDDEETPAPQPPVENTPIPEVVEVQPTAIGTQVIFSFPAPTGTPTATPTFDFLLDDYSGRWTFEFQLAVVSDQPLPEVGTWLYTSVVTFTVDQYGIISGEGSLDPAHFDPACLISTESFDPFNYLLAGNIRDAGDSIFFDLVFIPFDSTLNEEYQVDCIYEETPRIESFQYIWPILNASGRSVFSIPVSESTLSDSGTFTIDAPVATNGSYNGQIEGEWNLIRQ